MCPFNSRNSARIHMKLQAIRHYYVPELCRRRMDSDTLRTISLCQCRAVSSRYFLVVVVNGCWDYVDRNSYGRKQIMPRKTFFSFHYQEDVWRAWNVRNSWVVGKDKESVGFYDASVFEASQKESDDALKNFLRDGLKNTSVTCVLAGQYTASRRWVRYEIVRSVLKGNGLLTVDIHGVKNSANIFGKKGIDPLSEVGVYCSNGQIYFAEIKSGKWVKYEDYTLAIPASDLWFTAPTTLDVTRISDHALRYDYAAQNGRENISGWIETAAGLAGR
ncbi:MTH538 TIR-like domain (DUF1863) [Serratia plymuthica]|nr:MTH538 TIR-like domain (DUF1863) [Serratia plymuthica]